MNNSKYFLVEAKEIPWGVCQRMTCDWKEALELYGSLKEHLEAVPCVIKLSSIGTYIDKDGIEKEYQKTIYEKRLAESKNITLLTGRIKKDIRDLLSYKNAYSAFLKECNENTLNISHAIELLNFSLLNGKERDNVLYNIENNTIKRRIAQTQLKYLNEINADLITILNKCLNINEKLEAINSKNEKYNKTEAAYLKNKNYLKTLGVDIDSQVSYEIPDISEIDIDDMCLNKINHIEGIEIGNIEDIDKEMHNVENIQQDYIVEYEGINTLEDKFKDVKDKLIINA